MRTCVGEGKTVQEAIQNALNQLNATIDEVDVEILEEPSSRRWGRRSKPALVRITRKRIEKKEDDSGFLSVVDGEIVLRGEVQEEIPLRIIFGADIQVKYMGQVRQKEVVLTDGLESLEIKLPEDKEPDLQYGITINENETKAELYWKRSPIIRYKLADHGGTNQLHLKIEEVTHEGPFLTMNMVREIIQIEGITEGLDLSELNEDILLQTQGLVEIARGREPEEGVPSTIKYFFQEEYREIDKDAVRIDHYEVHGIKGVEEGAVLAQKIPGSPGKPGVTVYGTPIPIKEMEEVAIEIGEGVMLSEDGMQAIATLSGLASLSGGVVSVTDVFELDGNADVSTGNITMDGGIIIKGNVLENVKVESRTGLIAVNGLVSGAILRTGGSITVLKNVVRSQLFAGGSTVAHMRLSAALAKISGLMEGLIKSYEAIATQADNIPFENLIKHLLELKFYDLPKEIKKFSDQVKELKDGTSDEIRLLDRSLMNNFVTPGPLQANNLNLLQDLFTAIRVEEAQLADMGSVESDIRVGYLQNSRVEASGSVEITGQGCFYSSILAGTGFKIANGVFRGGDVTLNEGNLIAKEFGGPTGIYTKLQLIRNGRVTATHVHPNVEVIIGDQSYKFDEPASTVKVSIQDGLLTVYSGSSKIHG